MKILSSIFLISICACISIELPAQKPKNAVISMNFSDGKEGDSIFIRRFTWNLKTPESYIRTWHQIHNGRINIRFDSMQHPGYFTFSNPKWKGYLPDTYLIEPGDNISIQVSRDSMQVSGKGSEKIKFWNEYRDLQKKIEKEYPLKLTAGQQKLHYDLQDKIVLSGMNLLEKYSTRMDLGTYQLLLTDLLGEDANYRLDVSGLVGYATADSTKKKYMDELYRSFTSTYKAHANRIKASSSVYSFYWPTVLLKKYFVDSFYMAKKNRDLPVELRFFRDRYQGKMRDLLITLLLNTYHHASDQLVPCLKEALTIVKDKELRSIVETLNINFLKGTRAFDFSLRDTTGKLVHLKDFAGKTILMDFWYTGCTNCILASEALQSFEAPFLKDSNFVFLSISIDRDKVTWLNSVRGGKYTSKGRINLYTDQRGFEDPLIKHYNIYGYPTLMMIDKKGNVLSARLPDPRKNNGEELIKIIKEALTL